MYEVATEYDGREVAIIKSGIQYKVALAGMIKMQTPKFEEIKDLLSKAPSHTGIWVEPSSKDKFLSILKNITNATYTINEEGFLVQKSSLSMNKYDKKIKEMLSEGKLYVFGISSITYLVDSVTGEIEEYPFEEMDPEQGYEHFVDENKYIFVISQNKLGKMNQEETLKEILE